MCSFCGCNEQSELGQSDLVESPVAIGFDARAFLGGLRNIYAQSSALAALLAPAGDFERRAKRASCKVGKEVLNRLVEKVGPEFVAYQVARVGYQLEHLKLADFFDGGTLKAHLYCVMWSHGVLLGEQNASVNLERIVCESLLSVSGNDLGSSIIFRIEYWSSSACWVAELHTLVLV